MTGKDYNRKSEKQKQPLKLDWYILQIQTKDWRKLSWIKKVERRTNTQHVVYPLCSKPQCSSLWVSKRFNCVTIVRWSPTVWENIYFICLVSMSISSTVFVFSSTIKKSDTSKMTTCCRWHFTLACPFYILFETICSLFRSETGTYLKKHQCNKSTMNTLLQACS